jgi:hypothetical protein
MPKFRLFDFFRKMLRDFIVLLLVKDTDKKKSLVVANATNLFVVGVSDVT